MKFPAFFRRRKQRNQDLDDEIRAHLAMAIRERIEKGEDPAEAEANARREFGNVTLVKEITREMWGWRWLEELLQDLRFGLRQLRRNPGFTAVAVITLALGIGANTAIFSLVDSVLLHPIPARDPGRLMEVYQYGKQWGRDLPDFVSPADFIDWKTQNNVFDGMAAITDADYDVEGGSTPIRIIGFRATPNLFSLLGVNPLVGRVFARPDTQPGKDNVVVLGYNLWREAFGSRRDVLGKTIRLNGKPFTVLGVMPASFRWPYFAPSDTLFVPLAFTGKDLVDRNTHELEVVARLKPSVAVAQAQAEMKAIGERLRTAYPQGRRDIGVWAAPLERLPWIWLFAKPLFEPLYAAAVLVLTFCCVNLANLLLVRGAARQHEVAVRAALGASRGRVVRQFLAEGVLLSGLGGLAGIAVAAWGANLVKALIPPDRLESIQGAHLNLSAFGFGLGVALISGMIFSIIPAWKVSKVDPQESIQQGGRTASPGMSAQRPRNILLLGESALALVLLFGGGAVLNGFRQLMRRDPGFNSRHVLTFAIDVNQQQYPKPETWTPFFERIASNLRTLPGVDSVAIAEGVPSTSRQTLVHFGVAGKVLPEGWSAWEAVYERVGSNYFETLQNPLEKGRYFTPTDTAGGRPVAIVNDMLARQYFGNQDPIGKLIDVWQGNNLQKKKTFEIIGIVRKVREYSLAQPFIPVIYAPESQDPINTMMIALRTKQDPRPLIPAIRRRAAGITSQPLYDVATIDQRYKDEAAFQRADATLFTGFALITLLLAAIGIYGVAAYGVSQRIHEIGIRMALGATKEQILRMVVEQGMWWVLLGAAFGCALLPAFQRLLIAMFSTGAPLSTRMKLQGGHYAIASALIAATSVIVVALLACYIPARRATKIDPMEALRYE